MNHTPPQATIEEFRRLYEAEFDELLPEEEARKVWLDTMELMVLLFKKPHRQSDAGGRGSAKMERTS